MSSLCVCFTSSNMIHTQSKHSSIALSKKILNTCLVPQSLNLAFLVPFQGFKIPDTKHGAIFLCYLDPTGIILTAAAIGIPRNPIKTLADHCCHVRGWVFANVPRNSMMITWKTAVQLSTHTNT